MKHKAQEALDEARQSIVDLLCCWEKAYTCGLINLMLLFRGKSKRHYKKYPG